MPTASPEALRQVVDNLTDEDVQMLLRMEITFGRKMGEYFACYDFGTAITPDSDEMVRIGTVAMIPACSSCSAEELFLRSSSSSLPKVVFLAWPESWKVGRKDIFRGLAGPLTSTVSIRRFLRSRRGA